MPTELWRRAKQVFEQVVELPPAARQRHLESECGAEGDLRRAVEELLAADASDDSLLADTAMVDMTRALEEERDRPWLGRSLSAYRIVAKLGNGGMGSVYLAERDDTEYRKQVAIKVLSLWLMTPENLRRFRLERQILAMLEHPNIARLLDGGTTSEGLPYLVMDYVEGVSLTAYCDRRRLTLRQRLELFIQVCAAVSFAHQNLVVHRDLKPQNILVTAGGVPKLLDFGIAKILEASSFIDGTGMTLTHQRLLTPDYASPEQIGGRPITTATDVYSLGVLLYELLAGVRPFSRHGRSLLEIEETARTRPPVPPSQAVARMAPSRAPATPADAADAGGTDAGGTDAGGTAPTEDTGQQPDGPDAVARNRRTRPRALARQLSGDLDNIVLRTLRSEPEERYGSAQELAEELRCYLLGLPVKARPAGWGYRLRKFVRRHALATASATAAAALILGFSIVTLHQSRRIERERDHALSEQARAEQIARLLVESFELADPSQTRGVQITAREILDSGARRVSRELANQPELEATMLYTIGKVHARLGLYDQARPLLEKSLATRTELFGDDHPSVAESRHEWADVLRNQGQLEAAEEAARRALEIRRRADPTEAGDSLHLLAEIRRHRGQRDEAIDLHEQALELQRATAGDQQPAYARGLTRLARSLRLHGERDRSEELYRQALAIQRQLDREDHPLTAEILKQLSRLVQARGDLAAAESLSRRALEMNRRLYGGAHPTIASSLSVLAYIERELGNPEAALDLYREALVMQRRLLGTGNPKLAGAIYNLAMVQHRDLRQLESAEALYREAVEVFRDGVGEEHINMGFFLLGLGGVLNDRGRPEEAEPLLVKALDLFTRLSRGGAEGRNAAMVKSELGGVLIKLRRYAEAEELLAACLPVLAEALGDEHRVTRRTRDRLARLGVETDRSHVDAQLEAEAGG